MGNHGRLLGRRGVLTAGVAVAATAAMLAGCTQSSGPGVSSNVKAFSWSNYKGETLNLLMSEHPLSASIKRNIGDFESKTGIKVNIETLTESNYMVKICL